MPIKMTIRLVTFPLSTFIQFQLRIPIGNQELTRNVSVHIANNNSNNNVMPPSRLNWQIKQRIRDMTSESPRNSIRINSPGNFPPLSPPISFFQVSALQRTRRFSNSIRLTHERYFHSFESTERSPLRCTLEALRSRGNVVSSLEQEEE